MQPRDPIDQTSRSVEDVLTDEDRDRIDRARDDDPDDDPENRLDIDGRLDTEDPDAEA